MLFFSAKPRSGEPVQVFTLREDGSVVQLTHEPRNVQVGGWSRGQLIGQSRTATGVGLLVAVDPSSGKLLTLWQGGSPIGDLVTAGLGGAIAFSTARSLWLLRSPGARPIRLTSDYAPVVSGGLVVAPSASFSSDGASALYSAAMGRATRIMATPIFQPSRHVVVSTGIPRACLTGTIKNCPHDRRRPPTASVGSLTSSDEVTNHRFGSNCRRARRARIDIPYQSPYGTD
jgi:hypothetical protein